MPPWINLPNLLTLSRLLLVPLVIRAILAARPLAALALFAAAAVTDVLDGALARRWKCATAMGAYLDPIADKCLLSGVFLALAAARIVPWWFVAVVFGRDLYILAAVGVFLTMSRVREFPPSVWGKASTFVQILTAVACMARELPEFRTWTPFSPVILWPSVVFTIWSGIHYTWRGVQLAREH